MSTMASQITSVSVVYSTVCSGPNQRKHQSSASLAFVRGIHRWPVNSSHKGPVTRNIYPFDDVIMLAIFLPDDWQYNDTSWHSKQCSELNDDDPPAFSLGAILVVVVIGGIMAAIGAIVRSYMWTRRRHLRAGAVVVVPTTQVGPAPPHQCYPPQPYPQQAQPYPQQAQPYPQQPQAYTAQYTNSRPYPVQQYTNSVAYNGSTTNAMPPPAPSSYVSHPPTPNGTSTVYWNPAASFQEPPPPTNTDDPPPPPYEQATNMKKFWWYGITSYLCVLTAMKTRFSRSRSKFPTWLELCNNHIS